MRRSRNMDVTLDAIMEFLGECSEDVIERYAADPKELLRERGVIFSDKSEELFDAVYGDDPAHRHVVCKGGRGTGKTFIIVLALGCRLLFKKDDIFHLAGSEDQAKTGFGYIRNFVYGDAELSAFMEDELKTAATTIFGNWYKIAACSGKSVRGPHCGDPHKEMGNVAHGGVCYTDEEMEIPDEIVDAVKHTISTARPSKRIRSSTSHKPIGRFQQVCRNPKKYGAHLIEIDVIDVSTTCTEDCAKCPMGHYFAGALLGGLPNKRPARNQQMEFQGRKVPNVPIANETTAKAFEAWKAANDFPSHERAMCEGRAKCHKPGHYEMETIFSLIRDSQNRRSDDVEMFNRDRRNGNLVLSGAMLEQCLVPDAGFITGGGDVSATMDWGWNWTVFILWQEQYLRQVPFLVEYWTNVPISEVRERIARYGEEYGFWEIYADASHKHENAELTLEGFDLIQVPFAEWKDFGVRWLEGITDSRQFAFPGKIVAPLDAIGTEGKYVFPSEGHGKLFDQLLKWHTKDGKIVKQNDHGPDSCICRARKYAADCEPMKLEVRGTGKRASATIWGNR
jgi:hypothetical protein